LETVLLLMAAFSTAVLGAVCGIGGGILLKPLLDACFGMDAAAASFLSGCTVLAMAAVALLRSAVFAKQAQGKAPRLDLRAGTILSVGAALGGVLGKLLFQWLAGFFSGSRVGTAQSLAILILCAAVLAYLLLKKRIRSRRVTHPVPIAGTGLALGVISSFLGIGGGPFNHMALSLLFGMDTKTCAVHSLYIVLFSQAASLASVAVTGAWPVFDRGALLLMAAGGALGGYIGSALSKRAGQRQVEWTLGGALILIMGVCAYNAMRFWNAS
jgi:uncharacterized membrane protein YfcA